MVIQKLRKIWGSLFSAKKNIFSESDPKNACPQTGKNTDANLQLLYHRDLKNIQSGDCAAEPLQHDWWIN
ncbi:MAG: hypothetical protein ABJB86_01600 [Bacteroidota bacterium]